MHTLKYSLIILLLGFITSCSKEDEAPSTSAIILQGKWRIALYSDNGAVKTSNYAGYELTFKSNNTITVVKNNTPVNGSWSTGTDEKLNKFFINFNSAPLNELNTDWVFTWKSYTVLELESGSNTGTDVLILEKI